MAGRWKGGRGGTATGLPLFWTSPKERSKVPTDAAGLWKGWWRDGGWADAAGQCHGGVA